jgi:hypothetical protein
MHDSQGTRKTEVSAEELSLPFCTIDVAKADLLKWQQRVVKSQ